ncbi:hypothetical protein BJP36_07430 [Moorena producens JHB]|uniref:Uncharacterized protein n=1 Tax=Moorena producens (strain JHB) TaxID=1454205 RepID=A0A1D9FWQ9_MOOP1|nr:hypothetical protein [Moorena producens]AOY79781.1 hypothetical protein BJP36_07430 [Moorena producens JHB]
MVETDQVFKPFKPTPGESVEEGNNKRELIATHKSFQYGFKPFPFVVETSAVLKDDFRFLVEGMDISHLSIKVISWLLATEEAVTDTSNFSRTYFSKSE